MGENDLFSTFVHLRGITMFTISIVTQKYITWHLESMKHKFKMFIDMYIMYLGQAQVIKDFWNLETASFSKVVIVLS